MTRQNSAADGRPLVVCLHFLGGSARSWERVARRLDAVADCLMLDLPGFGGAADTPGYTVAAMADFVVRAVRTAAPARWLLAGHSMGAKVAAVVARRAAAGVAGLSGLAGLVLVAGSPPGPEPMADDRRAAMLAWFTGDHATSRQQADGFVRDSIGAPLDDAVHEDAVGEVLRLNPAAWRAWLESGSREDWADQVGRLDVPTLVLAGREDADLGPDMQREVMERHFARGRLIGLPGAGHLLPLERPDAVAAAIAGEIHKLGASPGAGYRQVIDSDRVSEGTRALLMVRGLPDDPAYAPRAIGPVQLATLRAVLERVIPQGGAPIDLAARIDAQLAAGDGDGWRCAELPADAEAYRCGLDTLDALAGQRFADLTAERQDAVLRQVAAGQSCAAPLTGRQMKLWFEDVRSDAVRLYVAHPATLARMGYSGIGYGGDGEPKSGFHRVGIDEREAWEPEALVP